MAEGAISLYSIYADTCSSFWHSTVVMLDDYRCTILFGTIFFWLFVKTNILLLYTMCTQHFWILKEIHMNQEARSSLTCDSCLMIGRWPNWTAYCTLCLSIIVLFNVLCDWMYHYILLHEYVYTCMWKKLKTDGLSFKGNNKRLLNRSLQCMCDILF